MKITINLTPAEVRGIKNYLKAIADISKPVKADIKQEVRGIVNGAFQYPHSALADYVQAEQAMEHVTEWLTDNVRKEAKEIWDSHIEGLDTKRICAIDLIMTAAGSAGHSITRVDALNIFNKYCK